MKYICPFCYKVMPQSQEPNYWRCCGEVGHATILPECPKCGAEDYDAHWLVDKCLVCGHTTEEPVRGLGAVGGDCTP